MIFQVLIASAAISVLPILAAVVPRIYHSSWPCAYGLTAHYWFYHDAFRRSRGVSWPSIWLVQFYGRKILRRGPKDRR